MGMVLSILAQCHVPCSQCPVAHVTMPENLRCPHCICLVPFVKNLYILGNFQMGKCPRCPCPVPTNFEWENCLCPSTFLPCPGPTLINQIVFGREFCCGFRHALKIKTCKWGAVWIEKL